MSVLESLKGMLDREYEKNPEIIDGCDVHEAAKVVDLSVAYTPVLEHRLPEEHGFSFVEKPDRVVKDGMRYCLTWPERKDFRWVEVESLKVMRARFLLWHGHFYKVFRSLPNPSQSQVLAWYFNGSMWQPKEGSVLAKGMGIL